MNNSLLMVPIHLDALYLQNGTSVAEAMVEFNRLPYFNEERDVNPDIVNLSESIVSKPFQNRNLYLKPGIHLHWALPDALTKQNADGEFPIVPNRWLVTRRQGANSQSWVVESDYLHPATNRFQEDSITYPYQSDPKLPDPKLPPFRYLGRKLTLTEWQNPSPAPNQKDEYLQQLTAVGYGEPTFAAFYPNCRSVFGFHDPDLTDPNNLTNLTYDIIGWYSQEQDYLNRFFRGFEKRFKEDSKRVNQGLEKSPTPEDFINAIEEELKWKILPGSAISSSSTSNAPQPESAEQRKARIDALKQAFVWQETLNQDSFVPQIVCFSRLTFTNASGKPPTETVNIKLTVANTGTEALSAYLAETMNSSQKAIVEEQLEALQLAETLEQQQLDTGFKFEELRHEAGFNAVSGGTLWRIQLDTARNQANSETTSAQTSLDLPDELAKLLDNLNQIQQTYDSAWAKIISRRRQLFSDWYKYMVSTYPPEDSWDHYPDIDDVKHYIECQGIQPLTDRLIEIGATETALSKQIKDLNGAIAAHNEKVTKKHNSLSEDKRASLPPPPTYSLEQTGSARYWEPKEPVVLIVGDDAVKASQRHGEDGRSDPDGLLHCHLLTLPEQIGNIRDKKYIQEIAEQISNKLNELQQANSTQIGFATWEKQPWNPILLEWLIELFPVLKGSNKNNETNYNYQDNFITQNYSLGINAVDLSPSSTLSIKSETSNPVKIDTEPNIYSGSSILTPYANSLLQKRIEEYLSKHEDTGETTVENPVYQKIVAYQSQLEKKQPRDLETENYLRQNISNKVPKYESVVRIDANPQLGSLETIRTLRQWYEDNKLDRIPHPVATAKEAQAILQKLNCLSQALGGFNQALLMHKQTLQLAIDDPIGFSDYQTFTDLVQTAVGTEVRSAPQPLDDFNPIRSGEMRIIDLQLIDTFGQVRNLNWSESVIKPEGLKTETPNRIVLPPRFVQPCRINFRWLSGHDQDNREMSDRPSTSPICGWILPNNLNGSLMIYSSDGQALGSININAEWDYAPGEAQVEIEQIENPHLRKVVQTIVKLGVDFVEHFNECLNNALNNIDPENFAQHQSLALLMGRPIAVVRASINFELQGLPAINQDWNVFRREMERNARLEDRDTDNFIGVNLPIRIGEYRQLNDGVIGYWKEKKSASGEIEYENNIFYAQQSDMNESQYIETQFWDKSNNPGGAEESLINIIQSIDSEPQTLTMLVDPRGVFHATSGVLPSKAISIPPEHYAKALANIRATFLTTPILTEQTQPKRLRLPLPTDPDYDWIWLERQGREGWSELLTFPVIEKSEFTQAYSKNSSEGDRTWEKLVSQNWLIERNYLLAFWWKWYLKIQIEQFIKPEELGMWFISLVYHLSMRRRTAQVVPKDKRPKLTKPLENLDEEIERLFDLYAVSIQPVSSKAVFGASQEIREGWLVLSEPQKPIELPKSK